MAFADLSIGIVSADKLELIYQLPNAHGFAITNLVFTRETAQTKKPILCSSSADGTMAFTVVPEKSSGGLF